MNRSLRFLASTLLALVLPMQGVAAACAQICDLVDAARDPAVEVVLHAGEGAGHAPHAPDGPCHDSGLGAGKCCNGHTFLMELPSAVVASAPTFFERDCSVARWTSFIPEEPSPPPIAAAPIA